MHILRNLVARFSPTKNTTNQNRDRDTTCESELLAQIGYHRLETRLVLSASWTLAGGLLTLDGFDVGQDLTFSQGVTEIGGMNVDAYIFDVDSGSWSGILQAGIELEGGGSTLEVSSSLVTVGLTIDGGDNIGITQGSAFAINNFDISNFSLTDQSFILDIDGHLQLENISVSDTDPNDALNTEIDVQATGSIDVSGMIINQSSNQDASISLHATGVDSDIISHGANIETGGGDVLLTAADEISLLDGSGVSTTIVSGANGNVFITANSDNVDGNSSDGILLSDGSTIDATDGDITLSAMGADGGDITLGNLTTSGAVSIEATGQIIDGTANEIANIVGLRTDLIGASIGETDDINIQVDHLSFHSGSDVQITDLVGSLSVDANSSAQNDVKLIVGDAAGENLLITQAINVSTGDLLLDVAGNVTQMGSGTITAGGLALMVDGTTRLQLGNDINVLAANTGDTVLYNDLNGLTIGTVTVLDGTGDQMQIIGITTTNDDVKLIAGGNLAINQAINLGTGDLFLDVAGNVTQTAPGTITAGGLALMVDGTTRLQLGNDVNVLAANTGDTVLFNDINGLTIGTVTVLDGTGDQMQIIGITTTNDDVKLIAGGNLAINQAINLGAGDLFLDVAGNVTQTAPGTITAGGLALMVDGTTRLQLGNDVNVLAANTGDTVLFNDLNGLTIGTVTVLDGTGDQMQIIGITTTNDDVKLIAGGEPGHQPGDQSWYGRLVSGRGRQCDADRSRYDHRRRPRVDG